MVLGAGMVGGVGGTAPAAAGWRVALVDRKAPGGLETSFGNAGLVQSKRSTLCLSRDWGQILHYASNQALDVRYHWNAMPREAPFLARYWYHSHPQRHMQIAKAWSGLILRSQDEHRALLQHGRHTVGARIRLATQAVLRAQNWMKKYATRSAASANMAWRSICRCHHAEPSRTRPAGTSGWGCAPHPGLVRGRPWGVVQASTHGCSCSAADVLRGDAASLASGLAGADRGGMLRARAAVVAFGAVVRCLCRRLGYSGTDGAQAGYHRHYASTGAIALRHPVLDAEQGLRTGAYGAGCG